MAGWTPGTGRSTTLIEMGGFEIDPEETRAQWEEALSMIPRMWMEDPFSHTGHYFNIPPRSVIPKPVQKPHPPLWMACAQPSSLRVAGELGLGALAFNLGGYEETLERVTAYREGIKNAKPVGAFVNNQMATLCLVYVGEDDREAKEIGGPEGQWFVNKTNDIYRPWYEQGVNVPESYRFSVSPRGDAPIGSRRRWRTT